MRIGVVKERVAGENRVAATPTSAAQLVKLGYEVLVESDAGQAAGFINSSYEQCTITDSETVLSADIVLSVNALPLDQYDLMRAGATAISTVYPAQNPDLIETVTAKCITLLALDMVPRISRAQSMDVLSSMANISGYRAVVEAAHNFGRFFGGQITAAGKVPPAKVMVIGAGVAGLAAIGAAVSLGAIVRAFDTRPEVAEQIESMGGEFLALDYEEDQDSSDGYAKEMSQAFIDAEMALFKAQAAEVDIIITTAAIPGKPSPKLLPTYIVDEMKPGSVIVDLAALGGGNCELTSPGELIDYNGVKIIGYTDMPSRLPGQSSQLYATNIVNFLKLTTANKDGEFSLDFDDVVQRNVTVCKDGELMFPPPPVQVSAAPVVEKVAEQTAEVKPEQKERPWFKPLLMAAGMGLFAWVGSVSPPDFLSHMIVFVLACVVGYYVVWNVTHALHTPLMSVTNAISGIIVIGAVTQIGHGNMIVDVLSFIAILIASINIAGGFAVTKRMLAMFVKEEGNQ